MSAIARTSFAEKLRRVLAVAGAILVLALAIFAASPVAHEWLHIDNGHRTGEDSCAVVLFAGGVSVPVGPLDVPKPSEGNRVTSLAIPTEVWLVSPRYLRQPERGPPGR